MEQSDIDENLALIQEGINRAKETLKRQKAYGKHGAENVALDAYMVLNTGMTALAAWKQPQRPEPAEPKAKVQEATAN